LVHEKPPPKKSKKLTDAPTTQQTPTTSAALPSTGGEVKVPKKRGPKPKKKLLDERAVPNSDDSVSLPPPPSLPAGQSLLKLKLSAGSTFGGKNVDKSELVFRTPGGKKLKRKAADFSEDSSSNDADHLFREAASKTTEQIPDQLFDDGHLSGH
jgi:hypothetical protein